LCAACANEAAAVKARFTIIKQVEIVGARPGPCSLFSSGTKMSGIKPPVISPKGAGALLLLIACASEVSGRASAADLTLRIAPKARHEAPAATGGQPKSLYEQFLRWKRSLFH
jgi:hypothetical protein